MHTSELPLLKDSEPASNFCLSQNPCLLLKAKKRLRRKDDRVGETQSGFQATAKGFEQGRPWEPSSLGFWEAIFKPPNGCAFFIK